MAKGEQKKCNKHGYYWVGLCCDGQIAKDICPLCLEAAAPDLYAVVEDMLSGLAYLRQTNRIPYGFGIDRLEQTGKAALAKAGKEK